MHDELCLSLLSAAHGWSGEAPSEELKHATGRFLAGVRADSSRLRRIIESLHTVDQGAATWIAVTCGTAIEQGANPELTGDAILELFVSWLPKFPVVVSEAESTPEPSPKQAALLLLFPFLCQSVVSHLARMPARRESMGSDAALIERLDQLGGFSHGATWVREALVKSSGAVMLLHPPSRSGVRVRYSNVANCFHLFSLLQAVIGTRIPGGRTPNAKVAQVARGQSSEPVTDEAWWHYGNPHSNKADLKASIWGEGLVREIPVVDGSQVMLVWPQILKSRTWDGAFLGPHLEAMPADAVMDKEMSADESAAWLKRLGVENAKKWWRGWR